MIALFLWLPHQTSWKKKSKRIIARMRVWTDWKVVSDIGHVPKGLGNKVNLNELESASVRPPNKLLKSNKIKKIYFTDPSFREDWVNNIKSQSKYFTHSPHYKSGLALSIKDYFELIDQPDHSSHLQDLVTLALKTWVNKH